MNEKVRIESGYSMKNGIGFESNREKSCYAITTIEKDGKIVKRQTKDFTKPIGDKEQVAALAYYVLIIWLTMRVLGDGWINVFRGFLMATIFLFVFVFLTMRIFSVETCKFHGAEHMLINAYSDLGRVPTLEELKKYTRFSKYCGGNETLIVTFMLILMLWCTFMFTLLQSCIILVCSLIVLVFFWQLGWLNFIQLLTTMKPTDKELELAIEAAEYWEECEEEFKARDDYEEAFKPIDGFEIEKNIQEFIEKDEN